MKILLPSELPNNDPISCFLYGQPGVGKTTFALSSPNPILLDFEHGLKRVSKQFQTASVQVEKWEDVSELINSEDIAQFDSIVIDTFGAVIDSGFDYICKQNPKLKSANGTPTQQGWGSIKNVIMSFHRDLMKLNKNIIYIAHDKETGAEDNQRTRPDAAGSSYRDIIKQTDIVGYMSMRGNKRTICFTPTDEFIAKNSLGLAGYIDIPTTQTNNNFFAKILDDLRAKRAQENSERVKYDALLAEQDEQIKHVETMQDLLVLLDAQKEKDTAEIWGSKTIMWCKIKKLAKEKFGMVYDNVSKQFVEEANNA